MSITSVSGCWEKSKTRTPERYNQSRSSWLAALPLELSDGFNPESTQRYPVLSAALDIAEYRFPSGVPEWFANSDLVVHGGS